MKHKTAHNLVTKAVKGYIFDRLDFAAGLYDAGLREPFMVRAHKERGRLLTALDVLRQGALTHRKEDNEIIR